MKRLIQLFFFGLVAFVGCKQPFESPVSQLSKDVLCIEGFINTGGEVSSITLSRLQDLKDSIMLPELKAKVFLQEENGATMALTEVGLGKYTLDPRTYDANKRYRLEITRNNGRKYQSEFVAITTAPPIDQLNYRVDSNGVAIMLDAHNAIDAPRYYYWDYEETWQFSVPYPSKYYYQDNKFIKRVEDVEYCYRTEYSNKLVLGTTANLTTNTVKNQEIAFADSRTGRLAIIYSINVKQHAIDKAYFEYLQKMKKNTEDIGTIFDAQPTQNTTNFVSISNPEETVVGYFNMHAVQQKRIFIKANELPTFQYKPNLECTIQPYDFWTKNKAGDYIYLNPEVYFMDPKKFIPVSYNESLPYSSTVSGVTPECGDCRTKGVLAKPSFWPY